MKAIQSTRTPAGDQNGDSLLAGAILAALLALVFGACLFTILDATRPIGPIVAVKQAAEHIHTASF